MCEYCDMALVKKVNGYLIHKPLQMRSISNWKRIKADGKHPMMYLRETDIETTHLWDLVCEFNNEEKNAVRTPIIYCPRCGDKLVGRN